MDGLGVGDVSEVVLEDRRILSQNGFIVAVVVIDLYTGRLLSTPKIISRGLVYNQEAEALMRGLEERAKKVAEGGGTAALIAKQLKAVLAGYVQSATGRRPMILPVVEAV